MKPFRRMGLLFFAAALACACSGGAPDSGGAAPPPPPPPPVVLRGDVSILFMGNSHTSVNALPQMVGAMVEAARPGREVIVSVAPSWMFLDERASDGPSLELLRSRPWTFVVLQAQKYSSSGLFDYPITGAVALVRMARAQQATPILFPEWPRLGIPESQRIFDLHVSIARAEPACVAPIPQAFDIAATRFPQLVLHAEDGNHSSPAGALLAALVIATTMTQSDPMQVPFLPDFPVDAGTQTRLRSIAAETMARFPPRLYCPIDPALP